ncbi:DUF3025 domain-containing protein [uncultured Oxalicibacterium sp.]|uniref:DUF3025 domain-containing protein n=1 Tax=uncultured Oxalicibacterium sp. TaxID=1168540 RepID=UPI0025FF439B|nr:DUF3025 domain-containing protein [uncultured Oxalicibacterium sp.]
MQASFLQDIDWSSPWLAHVREVGQAIATAPDWRDALNRAIAERGVCNHRGMLVHFVPQADLPVGTAYEHFISETGGVPTRDNLHDFFNALVWLHYPCIKVQLNALQAKEIAQQLSMPAGIGHAPRGKVRDAATIFDENAVLFVTSEPLFVEMLRQHRWQELFVMQRDVLMRQSRISLFGHALMEKLIKPYKAITGHVWAVLMDGEVSSDQAAMAAVDCHVAQQIAHGVSTADFSPLPVLGVPDWWQGQDAAFYADQGVFRPPRLRATVKV